MKYAIISDIHGNLPALELVIQDAQAHGAQAWLFAGDYCTSAPWGRAVVERLQSLPNAKAVCGNEEAYLHLPKGEDGQFQVTYWSAAQLGAEHLAWLDALPGQLDWQCDGVSLHMTHSSEPFLSREESGPFRTSRLPLRYPDGPVTRDFFLNDLRSTLARSISFQQRLSSLPKGVYIFGHTHSQWHAWFGDHLFINPGSCGLPLDCGDFGAVYTLLTVESGICTVEERRIPYDAEQLIAQVKQSSQYAATRVWSDVIFEEWRACRERMIYFLRHTEQYAQAVGDPRRPFMAETWQQAWADWMAHGEKP